MNPDQIKEAAIEAFAIALRRTYIPDSNWNDVHETLRVPYRKVARTLINTYEAAMWRPIEEAPKDASAHLFYTPQYRGRTIVASLYPDGQMEKHEAAIFTHFRPIPQPPVSAAIRAAGEE